MQRIAQSFSSIGALFLVRTVIAASPMDPSVLQENHLMHKILKNEKYCVESYEEGKIFLDQTKITPSAQGPVLDLNGQEFVPLPLLRREDSRYFLEHGFFDLFNHRLEQEPKESEQQLCGTCLEPVDAVNRCQNQACKFYSFLVEVVSASSKDQSALEKTGSTVAASSPPSSAPKTKNGENPEAPPPFPIALFVDNAAIGFANTVPPTNGLLVGGNTSIGSTSATALFNVGSSNQFQVNASGVASAPQYNLNGSISGIISLLPQAAAGTYNFNFPTDAGVAGDLLTSGGGGASAMTWTNPSSSFVTSLSGTANQISASAATGAVTLSFTNGISIGSYQPTAPPTGGIIAPGNVGIGTTTFIGTSPKLQVTNTGTNTYLSITGDVAQQQALQFNDGAANWVLYKPASTTELRLFSTSDVFTMQSDGDAGFSTTTPGSRVSINGNFAVGSTYSALAAPVGGAIVEGAVGIGVSSGFSDSKVQITTSATKRNLYLTGSLTNPFPAILEIDSTLQIDSGTGDAFGMFVFPNPLAGVGTMNNCFGIYISSGASNVVPTNGYGLFVANPNFGTNKAAILTENLSVGYAATSPPSNGAIITGDVGIGTSSPNFKIDIERDDGVTSGEHTIGWLARSNTGQPGLLIGYRADGAAVSRPFIRGGGIGTTGLTLGADGTNISTMFLSASTNGVSIGTNYSLLTGPANGMIVEGKVGIGMNPPATTLDCAPDSGAVDGYGNTNARFYGTSGVIIGSITANTAYIGSGSSSANGLNFYTNGTGTPLFTMRLTNGGNVGVNQANPLSKLAISGNLSVGTTYGALAAPTSGAIIEGFVGIGTTSPSAPLNTSGSNAGRLDSIYIDNRNNGGATGKGGAIVFRTNDTLGANHNQALINTATESADALNSSLVFQTVLADAAAEKMRIMSTGNVGLSTSAPGSRLGVNGNAAIGSTYCLLAAPTDGAIIEGRVGLGTSGPAGDTKLHIGMSALRIGMIIDGSSASTDGVFQVGADIAPAFSPTSNTTNTVGVFVPVTYSPPMGITITNGIGILVNGGTQSGAGTVTNGYGLYVENPTYGTNKYAAHFGGSVGIGITTPRALLHVEGSQAFKITVPGAYPYSILTTDYLIAVDTSAARSIVLPTAAAGNSGVHYIVKDATGSAAANNITVTVNGGGNIDGAASSVINVNYGSRQFYSNGTQWFSL